ncbi:MAG TPA: DUF3000 domain-containing protein [Mycobacteriales bacterium]|nr:DUF3000 domain-containing protein [Mycobacteriales bacterium]
MTEPHPQLAAPPEFVRAVDSLTRCRIRPDVVVETVKAPRRPARWSHALSAEVVGDDETVATGRLILLGDPDSADAWDGTLRLVTYASAELDADMAGDPMLAEVGWSWLIESLEHRAASHTAIGGTVTQTSSARFGDLAGPPHVVELELRASWTPLDDDMGPHLLAWVDLLCTAAGVPPAGITALSARARDH